MKRRLAMFLVCVMLLTLPQLSVFAASFPDTEGTNYETAVEVLAAFGIVEGKPEGNYDPDGSLTRAEMATIILRAINLADGITGKDIFADVPSTHWAYSYVSAAYQMGIINGIDAQTFAPDATVTYEQAVKMVVAALGYGVQADALGGYPSGYLVKATQLDLLKGVATDATMTRGNMAILIYNALEAPLAERASYGNDNLEYTFDEDVTLLTRYQNATRIESKIVQTATAAAIKETSNLSSDEVVVPVNGKNQVMKAGKVDVESLFAIPSDVYYKEDEAVGMNVLVAVIPSNNSKVVDLVGKDVNTGKTTANTLFYEVEKDEKKAEITGATLVYNGRVIAMDKALLAPKSGSVRLVFDNGTKCNTVIVEEYKNYVIKSVIAKDNKVIFENGSSMIIDLESTDVKNILKDADGNDLALEDLLSGDILSVAQDSESNATIRKIYSSYEVLEGTVTEMDKTDSTVVIDDETYNVSMNLAEIPVGKPAAFRLDYFGTIAAIGELSAEMRNYAWLKNAAYTPGISPKAQIYIFTADEEWLLLTAAEHVTFNGTRILGKDLLKNGKIIERMYDSKTAPTLVDNNGVVVPQLISYEVDEEGYLISIETAVNESRLDTPAEDKAGGEFSLDYFMRGNSNLQAAEGNGPSRMYNGTLEGSEEGKNAALGDRAVEYISHTLFSRLRIESGVPYFIIPYDASIEKDYAVLDAKNEFRGIDVFRRVAVKACLVFYDMDMDYICGAVVNRRDLLPTTSDSGLELPDGEARAALVLGFSKLVSEETGEIVDVLKLHSNAGEEIDAIINEDNSRIFYRGANARLWSRTALENGQIVTLPGDPDWYMLKSDKVTKYQPAVTDPEIKGERSRAKDIFIDVADLMPGDIIQYELNTDGTLKTGSVMYRAEYPGDVEMGVTNLYGPQITSPDELYTGGLTITDGYVVKVLDGGSVLVETNLAKGDGVGTYGKSYTISGEPSGYKTTRALPSATGYYAVWDTETEELTRITPEELVVGDKIVSYYSKYTLMMCIAYR